MGVYLSRTATLTASQVYSVVNGTAYANLAAAEAAMVGSTVEGVFAIFVQSDGGIDAVGIYEKVAAGSRTRYDPTPVPNANSWEQYVYLLKEGWDVLLHDAGLGSSVRVSVRRVDRDTVATL